MKHFDRACASGVNPAILSSVQSRTLALAVAVVALAWGRPALAQGQRVSIDAALHTSDKPYIQAAGEATVSEKPDQAVIEIGVVSQASNANAASTQTRNKRIRFSPNSTLCLVGARR
jgi:uncharacterized protein YggE